MAIEAYHQGNKRGVDALEPEVAPDDVVDTPFCGAWHSNQILQKAFRHHATHYPHCKYGQQMGAMLPLPHFKSEGLEDGKGKHREGATDGADADNFFLSLCHTAGKGKKELRNFMSFVTNSCRISQKFASGFMMAVPLHSKTSTQCFT